MPFNKNMKQPRNRSTNSTALSTVGSITRLQHETRATPKVGPTRFDPPPCSTGRTLYIDRTVRINLSAASTELLVSDVNSQFTGVGFKVLRISIWYLASQTAVATLASAVWGADNSGTAMTYTDIAPASRLPGIQFNIPDALALFQQTATGKILTGLNTAYAKVIDLTIRYQI